METIKNDENSVPEARASTFRVVNKNDRQPDIFQELREKKNKQRKAKAAVAADDPNEKNVDRSTPIFGWLAAALIGAVAGVICTNAWEGGQPGPETRVETYQQLAPATPNEKLPSNEGAASVIASLEAKHEAIHWITTISERRRANPFSIEIDDALIRPDARPVVAHGEVLDISYSTDNVVLEFGLFPKVDNRFNNILVLKCPNEKLKVFAPAIRGKSEFAVVAKFDTSKDSFDGRHEVFGTLIEAVDLSGTVDHSSP